MKTKIIKNKEQRKNKQSVFTVILLAFLSVYVITLFGLLLWGGLTAFKNFSLDYNLPGNTNHYGLPRNFTEYFSYFFKDFYMPTYGNTVEANIFNIILNSFLYAAGSAFFKTLVPCLTAYACARFNFKLGKIVYTCVIVAMIIPVVGSLPSEMRVARTLGLMNTIPGIWVMKANMLGLYFLVMYNAFKAMPNDYVEAAKIDGANNFQILSKIGLPIIATTFGTVFLLNFVEYWNDYQTPLVYLYDHPTMGFTLYALHYGQYVPEGLAEYAKVPPFVISFAFMLIIPTLILFLVSHKKLMSNVTVGGLKG